MVSDGFVTFTGHWPGYLAFVQHPAVISYLAGYDLGSSETPAKHRLLIDLQKRMAYVAIGEEVGRFLANQWAHEQSSQPMTLFVEDLDSLLKEWAESQQDLPTMEEVLRRMEEDQKAVQTLRTWLDEQRK
jgi:acyl carrier protein phosphodiesterase